MIISWIPGLPYPGSMWHWVCLTLFPREAIATDAATTVMTLML